MGDKFEEWGKKEKALVQAKNYPGVLEELENLLTSMRTYAVALKQADPSKFKGTTPVEKKNNYTKANETFKGYFASASEVKVNYTTLANPLASLKSAIKKAQVKAQNLTAQTPKEQFDNFNSQEFRGINLSAKMVEKTTTDNGIKQAIATFKQEAMKVNTMISGSGVFDPQAILNIANPALRTLLHALGE